MRVHAYHGGGLLPMQLARVSAYRRYESGFYHLRSCALPTIPLPTTADVLYCGAVYGGMALAQRRGVIPTAGFVPWFTMVVPPPGFHNAAVALPSKHAWRFLPRHMATLCALVALRSNASRTGSA